MIQARNKSNGNIVWTWFRPTGSGWLQNATPAAADNRVFGSAFTDYLTVQHDSFIVALNYTNGSELWRYDAYGGGGGYTAPVVTDDKVMFAGTASAFATAVDPANGNVIWRVKINSGIDESVPAVYGNQFFVLGRNGYLHAIK